MNLQELLFRNFIFTFRFHIVEFERLIVSAIEKCFSDSLSLSSMATGNAYKWFGELIVEYHLMISL